MPKGSRSDVRGIAKKQREFERQQKKQEKLTKRREAREQPPAPDVRAEKGPEEGRGDGRQ